MKGLHLDVNRLVQERRNSSTLAMELRLSCINPLLWSLHDPGNAWKYTAVFQHKNPIFIL